MKVPEAGGAEYIFKGLCIARYNKGIRSAFKLYNVYPESGGIVQHILLYMPDLISVKVVDRIPVKRNKLYYMLRKQIGSSYQSAPLPSIPPGSTATKAPVAGAGKGGAKKAKKSK
jgi:ribosomal protein L19